MLWRTSPQNDVGSGSSEGTTVGSCLWPGYPGVCQSRASCSGQCVCPGHCSFLSCPLPGPQHPSVICMPLEARPCDPEGTTWYLGLIHLCVLGHSSFLCQCREGVGEAAPMVLPTGDIPDLPSPPTARGGWPRTLLPSAPSLPLYDHPVQPAGLKGIRSYE